MEEGEEEEGASIYTHSLTRKVCCLIDSTYLPRINCMLEAGASQPGDPEMLVVL